VPTHKAEGGATKELPVPCNCPANCIRAILHGPANSHRPPARTLRELASGRGRCPPAARTPHTLPARLALCERTAASPSARFFLRTLAYRAGARRRGGCRALAAAALEPCGRAAARRPPGRRRRADREPVRPVAKPLAPLGQRWRRVSIGRRLIMAQR